MEAPMTEFRISVSWLPPGYGSPEIAQTAAALEIFVGGRTATLVEDEWSRSVQTNIRVSAYPLALWIASSWWRLRWEPRPFRSGTPQLSWRLAHEMPASGVGFLWPIVCFDSDGASIGVHGYSNLDSREPVRFLTNFHEVVRASTFELTAGDFVNTVLARLAACGVTGTPLEQLWHEVAQERRDPQSTRFRKLEALLGCDPDTANEDTLHALGKLAKTAGAAAVDEIAPVCADNPEATLVALNAIAHNPGTEGRPTLKLSIPQTPHNKPWELGWELADQVRQQMGLNGGPVRNADLAGLLVLSSAFSKLSPTSKAPLLSLAIRDASSGTLRFHFRKRNSPGLRFEAGRFLCEHLLSSTDGSWLPVTDIRTNRQKTQRAFAAQLLCPIEPLRECLNSDFSEEAIEQAAEHFEVSPRVVTSTLVSHGDISPDRIAD